MHNKLKPRFYIQPVQLWRFLWMWLWEGYESSKSYSIDEWNLFSAGLTAISMWQIHQVHLSWVWGQLSCSVLYLPHSQDCFPLAASVLWTLLISLHFHSVHHISSTKHGVHSLNWVLWVCTYCGRNEYNSHREAIFYSLILFPTHTSAVSPKTLLFPVSIIKLRDSCSVTEQHSLQERHL